MKIKVFRIISIIFLVFSIGLVYLVLIEPSLDVNVCREEFSTITGLSPVNSFANDAFFKFNFGKGIACTVFWYGYDYTGEDWLTHVKFESGSLTEELIDRNKYWRENLG